LAGRCKHFFQVLMGKSEGISVVESIIVEKKEKSQRFNAENIRDEWLKVSVQLSIFDLSSERSIG